MNGQVVCSAVETPYIMIAIALLKALTIGWLSRGKYNKTSAPG